MIASLAELLILGVVVDWVFRKLALPGLVGMLLLGVAFGPFALALVDTELLAASGDLRLMAVIVILLRAGFELSRQALRRVGGRVVLLAVIPALLEGLIVAALAKLLLGLGQLESAILGAVLAAVSPAVVVPLMIRFIEQNRGAEKGVPTMVLAASALNDVLVIIVYSVLVGFVGSQQVNLTWQLAGIPISIIIGIVVGFATGSVLCWLFQRVDPRATKRVLVILTLSVLLVHLEHFSAQWLPFSALLAIMVVSIVMLERDEHMAREISAKLGKVWIFAEIMLFTMVGAQVNLEVAWQAGLAGTIVILLGLMARSMGSWLCLLGSDLDRGERWFVVIAYLPKATVQAAIGGGALAAMSMAGLDTGPGEVILAVAVLSILLTAPLGAWGTDIAGRRWLRVAAPDPHATKDSVCQASALAE
ncbi:MAG TPA: cation:proton antiporter [Alphaproteobacteria bacterium]|jgi:NhaP-type Na+/H+ or K+/H+ antiporter|nr:cation:proton antiporter [Alphaproteobacteria bacterium]MDP7429098.1 cation:proton antiporter [Alphaproteobacteria bacterium]HJM50428.1 cation:proton antiporter [Alphaproteobacteria bacterium]